MTNQQKITPYLWFDNQAEEAAQFYTSLFPNSKLGSIQHQGEKTLLVEFFLGDQAFTALNGGPMFSFNPSISFYVVCENEAEINAIWGAMMVDGKALMPINQYPWSETYGWLEDKYGLSWQLTLGKVEEVGRKISPVLMFTGDQHGKAEEAVGMYTSLFENSKIKLLERYVEGDGDPAIGTIKYTQALLDGEILMAMDSSHMHGSRFNESISFLIHCKGQEEVDYFWEKLTADGGEEMMCAWLKDKYGVAWQIIPEEMKQLLSDPDPGRAERAMGAMMQMRKIEIDKMRAAAENTSRKTLTVQTTVAAPVEKVWGLWTSPEHITQWNFATEGWHCPTATNHLRIGGTFNYRMEAKDGSMGFDFTGTYLDLNEPAYIHYELDDKRAAQVRFTAVDEGTFVMQNFEVETSNDPEMQRQGWQAILDNFRRYVESN